MVADRPKGRAALWGKLGTDGCVYAALLPPPYELLTAATPKTAPAGTTYTTEAEAGSLSAHLERSLRATSSWSSRVSIWTL